MRHPQRKKICCREIGWARRPVDAPLCDVTVCIECPQVGSRAFCGCGIFVANSNREYSVISDVSTDLLLALLAVLFLGVSECTNKVLGGMWGQRGKVCVGRFADMLGVWHKHEGFSSWPALSHIQNSRPSDQDKACRVQFCIQYLDFGRRQNPGVGNALLMWLICVNIRSFWYRASKQPSWTSLCPVCSVKVTVVCGIALAQNVWAVWPGTASAHTAWLNVGVLSSL